MTLTEMFVVVYLYGNWFHTGQASRLYRLVCLSQNALKRRGYTSKDFDRIEGTVMSPGQWEWFDYLVENNVQ